MKLVLTNKRLIIQEEKKVSEIFLEQIKSKWSIR